MTDTRQTRIVEVLEASPFADNVSGIPEMCDLIVALRDERDALADSADLPVKVKPLAWGFRTIPEGEVVGIWMYARSIVGAYEVHTFEGRAHSGIAFLQCPNKSGLIEFPTTAEAKAAAQSDYETRIRECLE